MATYEEAEDQYILVKDVRIAFRLLGPQRGVPLLHLMQFRGTMDHIDPAVANALATNGPLILFDNRGVGRSQGEVPTSYKEAAQDCADFVAALGFEQVDVCGVSMGGCVGQILALDHPSLVRSLILCGSMPSIGQGVTLPPSAPFNALRYARSQVEYRAGFLSFCCHTSDESQASGVRAWNRMVNARRDRCEFLDAEGTRRQVISFARFMDPRQASDGSFERLHELQMPVLIVKGACDNVVTDETVEAMLGKMRNAEVEYHNFPDAGHTCHFQYPREFANVVKTFLDKRTQSSAMGRGYIESRSLAVKHQGYRL